MTQLVERGETMEAPVRTAQQVHRDLARRNPVDVKKLVVRLPTGRVQGWSTHHKGTVWASPHALLRSTTPFEGGTGLRAKDVAGLVILRDFEMLSEDASLEGEQGS